MKNQLKEKLYAGKPSLGTWLSIGSPDVADTLKQLPFDWFLIDLEHSYISIETARNIMLTVLDTKITPLVRVGESDQYLIKRALDIGAYGVLVPLVNTAAEAERVVNYSKYPPLGSRGVGPVRTAGYGNNLKDYVTTANDEILVGVQIETMQALANAEAIASTKGVDLVFVGPSDLTMSMGLVTDRGNPKVAEAMQSVVKVCEKAGKIPGTLAATPDEAKRARKLGFRFISLGSDSKYLFQGAKNFVEQAQA
ncbi:MAG TPA: aldolase/citrate lyase family protein [Nitrososphaerales archaeon]|nr:aldolase/citrate lyase family protein [Nitrososphaerales archaeon]